MLKYIKFHELVMVSEDHISYFKRMFFSSSKGVYCLQVLVSTRDTVKYLTH
jgi:hypothetical protein